MSNMSGLPMPDTFKDVLTLTNNYQGLGVDLTQVQDAAGNSSPMQIALQAVNFDRTDGNTFQLDGVALTASATNINEVCGGSTSSFTGGVIFNRTAVSVTPYNVLSTDYYVSVTANAAGVSVVLPAPSMETAGQTFVIQDEVGNAAANHITITAAGGALVNGAAGILLEVNYASVTVYNNGANYFCITGDFT